MTLQARFEQAVADSKNLPQRPDNMTMLKLYALYKQGSAGDAQGERPGMTDFIGRAKWDAWAALKGLATMRINRPLFPLYLRRGWLRL